jgi:hypothetical protein
MNGRALIENRERTSHETLCFGEWLGKLGDGWWFLIRSMRRITSVVWKWNVIDNFTHPCISDQIEGCLKVLWDKLPLRTLLFNLTAPMEQS